MKKYKILPFYKMEVENFKEELEKAILDFKGKNNIENNLWNIFKKEFNIINLINECFTYEEIYNILKENLEKEELYKYITFLGHDFIDIQEETYKQWKI